MTLLLYFIILIVAFYLIAQVSDRFFIPSLDAISDRLKIRSDVAGATFMAMGSSAPELFIALIAVFHPGGHAEIGMGTIVGSALFNVLAIIGGVALVRKAVVSWQPILRDTVFYLISIALLAFVFYNDEIHLLEALLLMAVYLAYIVAVIYWGKIFPYYDDAVDVGPTEKEPQVRRYKLLRFIIKPLDQLLKVTFPKEKYFIVNFSVSIIWIGLMSWVLVNSAIQISAILNVPEGIIALTVLAVGTSIPDMISSLIVAKKGRGGMAISNALGSNIFDILLGLGIPWLIVILLTGESVDVFSENIFLSVILLFSSVVIFYLLLMIRRWQIRKPTGIFLLALYLGYLIWQIAGVV